MTIERTVLQERLISIVKRFPQRRIVVVGDSVADQFVYGAISRVSREAPVFILRHEHTETVPGGAANCAANLSALGANVSLISVAGKDEAGRALVESLIAAGVDCSGVMTTDNLRTTTKVRILAGQLHSTRQQVIRIDYEGEPLNDHGLREQLRQRVLAAVSTAHAVILSDYNYGVADAEMAAFAGQAAKVRKIPVLADSRFSLTNFAGFTSATPNQDEVEQLLGRQLSSDSDLELAGEELRDRLGYRALLITRGSHGMTLLEDGVAPVHIEAVGAREPVDVTGAGDTVMAAYTLSLASDSSFPDAARIANYAGGLVVMKRGTAAITSEELMSSVLHSDDGRLHRTDI
ncbi:MAG: bifunctional ADP-heptose synthase [Acidobacteriota bacterium]|nr:bifunctional ADP-heptose synthase [Acidobacteriota bacterium]